MHYNDLIQKAVKWILKMEISISKILPIIKFPWTYPFTWKLGVIGRILSISWEPSTYILLYKILSFSKKLSRQMLQLKILSDSRNLSPNYASKQNFVQYIWTLHRYTSILNLLLGQGNIPQICFYKKLFKVREMRIEIL